MLVEKYRLIQENPLLYYMNGDFYIKALPIENENLSVCLYFAKKNFYIRVNDRLTGKYELYATNDSIVEIKSDIEEICSAYTNQRDQELCFETKLVEQSTTKNQQELTNDNC